MGCLAFPYQVKVCDDEEGHPQLYPINPDHYPASKMYSRMSTLCHIGPEVTKSVALTCPDLSCEDIAVVGNSSGECLGHFDFNDTGVRTRTAAPCTLTPRPHAHTAAPPPSPPASSLGPEQVGHLLADSPRPWGLSDVQAAGLRYHYGDEGLADGLHAGEELWHMVMVIGCNISEKEAQAVIGIKDGDPTCIFRFPPNVHHPLRRPPRHPSPHPPRHPPHRPPRLAHESTRERV
jgi:hypothetical protein